MPDEPEPQLASRIADMLGWAPRHWRRARGGYTPSARFVAIGDSGSAFVKVATTPVTVDMLHREIAVYRSVTASFVPRLIAADDDPDVPILVIEDLSAATWPPPWTSQRVEQVLTTIEAMHATETTLRLGSLLDARDEGWPKIAENPAPFLSLGLVSDRWLQAALPSLIAAERSCDLAGDALTHLDLRSDNLCVTREGVKFIDWAEARRSSPRVDLGFFLPSLAYEGGPLPDTILLDAPDLAALISGFFGLRAGLPDIPGSPFVRRVQREQLSTALPWTIRALGLPPADGAR
jgi:Phosphotransferase enzyme family